MSNISQYRSDCFQCLPLEVVRKLLLLLFGMFFPGDTTADTAAISGLYIDGFVDKVEIGFDDSADEVELEERYFCINNSNLLDLIFSVCVACCNSFSSDSFNAKSDFIFRVNK